MVQTERLDSIMDTLELESIDLLKVEEEGFEPEVLAGAERTLTRCRLVAVDCGPERDGFDTAARCVEILYDHGFKLSDTRMFSGRMLFTRGDVKARSGNRVGEAGQ